MLPAYLANHTFPTVQVARCDDVCLGGSVLHGHSPRLTSLGSPVNKYRTDEYDPGGVTPASKRMRSVSVNNASIDFTKYGPTDGSLAKDRDATVELGGGSAGSASVNSCNSASFTMQRCQHCNVATSRCCRVWSAPGPEMPRPRRRWPLKVVCPHRGPRAARLRQY